MFAFWQCDFELFDEGCDVAVADDFAFPFFDAHDGFWHFDAEVAFDFALASEAVVLFDLLAGEVAFFGVEYFAASFYYLAFALSAGAFSSAG